MLFPKLKIVGLAFYLVLAFKAAQTHAIALSQKPLFLTSGAEPNLMFVLDDSGSMQFEITPETYRLSTRANTVFAYPPANGYYGKNAYNTNVAAPGDRSVYGKLFRSKINTSYYDPSKLYTPWISTDGVTTMPDASPTCALHNPINTGTGETKCRNLTVEDDRKFASIDSTWTLCTSPTSCNTSTDNTWKYYPATYYWFSGSDSQVWDGTKYAEQKIISTTTSYTGHGRGDARTDCELKNGTRTCSYEKEIKNFANWYTYYRSRVLTARAGIGRAFAQQEDDIRVGFGTINRASNVVDGQSTQIIKTGVRKFTTERKTSFLRELYEVSIDGGTPLPNALDYVGQYYQRKDNNGPWSKSPGDNINESHVQCRASYALLMSDGYWTSRISTAGNADNTAGSPITNHTPGGVPASYTYSPSAPFSDGESNSLADVAMKYWKTDLRDDLNNRVKPNTIDPAFWQHMTTFTIGLGVEGNISPVPNVADVIKNKTSIAWPALVDAAENGTKVDDMVHAAINGRGDFFSAKDPDSFSARLASLLQDINAREKNNAAAAAANSTSLNTGSMVYNAMFDSRYWSGELKATAIKADGTFGDAVWTSSIPQESSRKIYTFNGSAGVELNWNNLSTTQKSALNNGSADDIGEKRLQWFRGIDDTVSRDAADLRNREGRLLGDIVNSDPAFAGNTNLRYDRLPADLGASSYTEYFNTQKKSRREMLYVGSNDGMLHGFNARVSTPDTMVAGREVFAYVPTQVIKNIPNLASESYGKDNEHPHKYMVDGPVYVSDAYIKGEWKNILVGTLGGGGRGIYVLDVTNPDSFNASNVLFELTEDQYKELGFITGTAIIAPGADNRWKIFVGNGYNSSVTGGAKAYLGVIDIQDEITRAKNDWKGETRTKFLVTDNISESALSQPALLPNQYGVVVAAYAGDMRGNLWKFDLSNSDAANWKVAYSGVPLFVAKKGDTRQPITASPTLGFNSKLSPARVMIYFGTGMYAASTDNQPSKEIQSFYAIADKGTVIPEAKGRSTLHVKSLSENNGKRTIGNEVNSDKTNAVNWANVDGWYLDFPESERIITKPLLIYDRLIFPTVKPSQDACESGGSGWLMELLAVGSPNPEYKLLGEKANKFLDVAIFGQFTSIEGSYRPATNASAPTSASSSSSVGSNECGGMSGGGSGVVAIVGIQSDGTQVSNVGSRPCELFNRQSWRELE